VHAGDDRLVRAEQCPLCDRSYMAARPGDSSRRMSPSCFTMPA
jgi:hypothetical protein